MPVKSKTKSKSSAKAKAKVKKAVVKAVKPRKLIAKAAKKAKTVGRVPGAGRKPVGRISSEKPVEVTRTVNLANQIRQPVKPASKKTSVRLSATNSNPFTFMKAPRPEYAFEVGDAVEVFCDHEKGRERVRGWIKGIVVQVDNKMVAVQFRSNVFLTDGWMVPDRILWYPLNSEHIRPVTTGRKAAVKKEAIPDY